MRRIACLFGRGVRCPQDMPGATPTPARLPRIARGPRVYGGRKRVYTGRHFLGRSTTRVVKPNNVQGLLGYYSKFTVSSIGTTRANTICISQYYLKGLWYKIQKASDCSGGPHIFPHGFWICLFVCLVCLFVLLNETRAVKPQGRFHSWLDAWMLGIRLHSGDFG